MGGTDGPWGITFGSRLVSIVHVDEVKQLIMDPLKGMREVNGKPTPAWQVKGWIKSRRQQEDIAVLQMEKAEAEQLKSEKQKAKNEYGEKLAHIEADAKEKTAVAKAKEEDAKKAKSDENNAKYEADKATADVALARLNVEK